MGWKLWGTMGQNKDSPSQGMVSFRHFHHNYTKYSLWAVWRIWTVTVDKGVLLWLEDKCTFKLSSVICSPRLIFRFMPVMVNISSVRGLLVSENESSCRGMRDESLHCDKDMIWDKADFEVCKVWGSFSPAFLLIGLSLVFSRLALAEDLRQCFILATVLSWAFDFLVTIMFLIMKDKHDDTYL